MIPILYESTETDFNSNGIGTLNDAVSCIVIQERAGVFELEMEYPLDGAHYSDLIMRNIIMALPDKLSDPQPFRVYEISKPIGGIATVYARHIAYDLMGIPVSPFVATSASEAMNKLKTCAATDCPFEFWTDKETTATMTVAAPSDIWGLLGGSAGGVLDVYGGEYEFDRWKVMLHKQRGYDRGVTIRYGKNMTDLQQEESCDSVYTGIYPYWADSEGNLEELPEKIVYASGTFSYTKIQPVDFSQEWQEAPTEEQLRTRAQRYVKENNIGVPKVSLSVAFAPLEQSEEYKDLQILQQVGLCDTVTVQFPKIGVDATAKCIKTEFDALLERYNKVELGESKSSFVDTIVAQGQEISQKPEVSFMRKAITELTASILGAKGGSVRLLDTDGDGEPDTLYIADHPDQSKAKKVWRFNYEGWGASKNGYNGPFTIGASFESGILADFITAGTLTAALIKAGVLSDKTGKNYWNMETGEFQLADSATVGGKSVTAIANGAVTEYDEKLNQEKMFAKLTNNGTVKAIIMKDGELYVNASYLSSGRINAKNVDVGGKLAVYSGDTMGGYVGYLEGATNKENTDGIGVIDATGENYVIATNKGVRIQAGSDGFWGWGNGHWTLDGNLYVTGDLTVDGTVSASNI